jgi:hypothetical protein
MQFDKTRNCDSWVGEVKGYGVSAVGIDWLQKGSNRQIIGSQRGGKCFDNRISLLKFGVITI